MPLVVPPPQLTRRISNCPHGVAISLSLSSRINARRVLAVQSLRSPDGLSKSVQFAAVDFKGTPKLRVLRVRSRRWQPCGPVDSAEVVVVATSLLRRPPSIKARTNPKNHPKQVPLGVLGDPGLDGIPGLGHAASGDECLNGLGVERPGVEVPLPAVALVPLQLGVLSRLFYPLGQGLEP
jgi:hypothetical protein